MYGEKRAVEKVMLVCSSCEGKIPNGCTCYGGTWVKGFGSGWEWIKNETTEWIAKKDPKVKVKFGGKRGW